MPRQLFLAANYQEDSTKLSLLFRNFAHLFERNKGTKMLTEKFFEVIRNEGVVSIRVMGPDNEMMHQKYPFIRSVLEVTAGVAKQML